jgi:hypothetical protein
MNPPSLPPVPDNGNGREQKEQKRETDRQTDTTLLLLLLLLRPVPSTHGPFGPVYVLEERVIL